MKEPLKAGDLCEVVGGLGRKASPNLGLQVTIKHRVHGEHGMDHTTLGPIYRCEGKGVCQISEVGTYNVTGWADFAVVWLRKITPPGQNTDATTEKAVEA